MKKILVLFLVISSISSLLITGWIVQAGISKPTQTLVVEFEYAGRFEVVYTHHGISESKIVFGEHQVLIFRNIKEPWSISFFAQRIDNAEAPLYVYIKTLEGETVFSTVLATRESVLNIDCTNTCNITT